MSEGARDVREIPEIPAWTYREVAALGEFPRTPWGRRGYDEVAVDAFMAQVSKDLRAADEEITDLRGEVDRLHTYIRRQWTAVAAAEAAAARAQGRPRPVDGGTATPAAQAGAVLSQAQELADRRLAEVAAEVTQVRSRARQESDLCRAQSRDDVRRLLQQARTRYEDIVTRAHQRAGRAAEVALGEFEAGAGVGVAGGRMRVELEMKAAYLRTFAKVSRVALTAALDVTAREFDRLLGSSGSLEQELAGGRAAAPDQSNAAGPDQRPGGRRVAATPRPATPSCPPALILLPTPS